MSLDDDADLSCLGCSVKLQNAIVSVPGTAASASFTQNTRLQPRLIASSSGRLPQGISGQPMPFTQELQLTAEGETGDLHSLTVAWSKGGYGTMFHGTHNQSSIQGLKVAVGSASRALIAHASQLIAKQQWQVPVRPMGHCKYRQPQDC